jgi:ATP-dependent DNA helicase RecQ
LTTRRRSDTSVSQDLHVQLLRWASKAELAVSDFRSGEQESAVRRVLDNEDLLVVMPTGAGKSLIYQFPAWIHSDSLTLVVSPLRALMNQQGEGLGADTINSDTLDRQDVWRRVASGKAFILLVSPEMLAHPSFRKNLARSLRAGRRGLGRFVVDEVHCLSDWGHDFRPHYWWVAHHLRTLESSCRLAQGVKRVPRLLLTATADRHVTADIIRHFPEVAAKFQHITTSVARPEIVLLAKKVTTRKQRLAVLTRFLARQSKRPLPKGVQRRGIIFNLEAVDHVVDENAATRERMKANDVTEALKEFGFSDVHTFTSKGMNKFTRSLSAEAFENATSRRGRVTAVVATSAFGMGMDYSQVPFVVHLYPRPSLAEYWQQVGRAGRDMNGAGCCAEALAIFSQDDHRYARRFAKAPALDGLLNAYTIPLFGWMYVWKKGGGMALKGASGRRLSKFGRLVHRLQELGVISSAEEAVNVPKGAVRSGGRKPKSTKTWGLTPVGYS